MRRGINIRKKNRILLNESNKKNLKLFVFFTLLLIICLFIYIFYINNNIIKQNFEKDSIELYNLSKNIPFSLNKIILFSSATAETDNVNQTISLDLSNYCDIAIFLDNLDKENTSINSLFINNIIISKPELGTPYLYKKRITDLGKSSFSEDSIVENNFYYNIISKDTKINYDNYELLENGTTPISIGFYNQYIKQNFIPDNTEISYNGTLLKNALIPKTSLNCIVSFDINIITNKDEHYICNVSFDIPFENKEGSLYDIGYITKELNENEINAFIRIK